MGKTTKDTKGTKRGTADERGGGTLECGSDSSRLVTAKRSFGSARHCNTRVLCQRMKAVPRLAGPHSNGTRNHCVLCCFATPSGQGGCGGMDKTTKGTKGELPISDFRLGPFAPLRLGVDPSFLPSARRQQVEQYEIRETS